MLAFYDRNNTCDPDDEVIEWSDSGDLIGGAAGNPIFIQTDIFGVSFPIAAVYATGSETAGYDEFDQASGLFDPERWRGDWSALEYVMDGTTPIADAEVFMRPIKHIFDHGFLAQTDAGVLYIVDSLSIKLYKVTAQAEAYVSLGCLAAGGGR